MIATHSEDHHARSEASTGRRNLLPIVVTVLDVLAIGVLAGLIIGNRVLTTQLAAYGGANMAASSVILDLMDDLFKPLVWAISGALGLTGLALGAWLLRGIRHAVLRWAAITLLVLIVGASAVWLGLGRQTSATPVPMVTPTPALSAPGP